MTNIIFKKSPNFADTEIPKKAIIIHWTAGGFDGAVSWLCNPKSKASTHFVMDRTGEKIVQLVDLTKTAWHFGGSWHPLLPQVNGSAVGIEVEGPPSVIKTAGWSPKLITRLAVLCIYCALTTGADGICDHSTINPVQKQDVKGGTGKDVFPWEDLVNMVSAGADLKDYSAEPYRSQIREHFGL
jgi:N-acetylmuramoyl-L-alanine amidase